MITSSSANGIAMTGYPVYAVPQAARASSISNSPIQSFSSNLEQHFVEYFSAETSTPLAKFDGIALSLARHY